ncbi:hypothetical protein JRO89_XS01G0260900 [Xanthoceras sorbifolium]|uniref:BHLH domain-containing protein n=1 Tax=Xanthoceras sorbifolium TaxID=99658 RepID=A0ABQ8ILE1_9ROSI|nr:hypothetical protein JRO89_XS01G0260900 [Xanthoceras sorbifolium]
MELSGVPIRQVVQAMEGKGREFLRLLVLSFFLSAILCILTAASSAKGNIDISRLSSATGKTYHISMEGQRDLEMSLNFGGSANDASYQPEDNPNRHFVMAAGRIGTQPNALSSPQWTHFQKAPHNYVEFLTENSTFLENASGADMLQSITSLAGGTQSVDGLSEIQRDFLFNDPGKACDFKPVDSSLDMNAWQNPHNEVQPANRFTNFQQQILTQNHTSWEQEPCGDDSNVPQLPPRVTVAPSFFLSKQRHNVSKQRAAATDRHRRMRIAERLRSLQELLPHSAEELSQSRLGGQPTSKPFIFLEGYGHYFISEQMTNDPLEEMMGKLLEANPATATKLLESKGLYMMPMSLAEGTDQSS